MGTELVRRGWAIGTSDWVGATPDVVAAIADLHRAYVVAGAELHIANTFATSRHVLASLGLERRFEAVNRTAVRICRDAGARWVAGSISTYVVGSDRANLPRGDRLARAVREHADLLADAGCDMIVLEMLFDAETSVEMIVAAASAGLAISAGLTFVEGPDGGLYLRGEYTGRLRHELRLDAALPDFVAAMPEGGIVTVMHTDLDPTDRALEAVRRHWSGPIGVYPNAGRLVPPDTWDHSAVPAPETFTARAARWDAAFIGGCCGLGPAHIAALGAALTPTDQGDR